MVFLTVFPGLYLRYVQHSVYCHDNELYDQNEIHWTKKLDTEGFLIIIEDKRTFLYLWQGMKICFTRKSFDKTKN